MKVEGKTMVVTGGANGMGRELVLLLLKRGARVAAVDINESALKETAVLAGEYQSRLSTHVVSVTDQQAVFALPEVVIQAHEAVDGLINNAGIIQRFVRVNDLGMQEIERVMDINFWGVVYMTKAFLPYLLQRPEAHLANVSSMGSYLPVPGQTFYGASKAAVTAFTDGLHSELLDTKVRVTTIFPGAIATNITVNSGVAIPTDDVSTKRTRMKLTSAADAARQMVDGIEKNAYHLYVGSDAKMMNFLSRLAPKSAAKFIYSQMRELLTD